MMRRCAPILREAGCAGATKSLQKPMQIRFCQPHSGFCRLSTRQKADKCLQKPTKAALIRKLGAARQHMRPAQGLAPACRQM